MRFLIITLLFFLTNIFAQTNAEISIDEQIAAIKNATPSQRVKLMNEFKIRVSQMNNQERSLAIQKVQSKISAQNNSSMKNTHALQMQMQNNSQVVEHQKMNQKQLGNQFGKGSGKMQNGTGNPHKIK